MKTICPHCKQEFPEIPDEYLDMILECPVCKKEFVCEKVMTPQEMAELHARQQNKRLRNRRILIIYIVLAAIAGILFCLPGAYDYYVYRRDCNNLKNFQAEKARRYNAAYPKMKAVLLRARNNRLGSNANHEHRKQNLKKFAADYNSASPELLGLPVLDDKAVESISMILYFKPVDVYDYLVEGQWRENIEEIFGPLEKLK